MNHSNAALVVGQRGPAVARGNGFRLKPAKKFFWSLFFFFLDAGVKIKGVICVF